MKVDVFENVRKSHGDSTTSITSPKPKKSIIKRKRKKGKGDYRSSQAAIMREKRASERDIDVDLIRNVIDPGRRESCRLDLKLFLETYMSEQFCLAWSDAHLRCISKMQYAIFNGGCFALAMPRGEGKTTIAKGAALWALLYGHKRYAVIVAATSKKAIQLIGSMKKTLRFNKMLLNDFPEVIVPIIDLQGNQHRAKGQTIHGNSTGIVWKAEEVCFPRSDDNKLSSESRIEVAGITGEIRGRNATLMDGSEIRPDMAICDDPQTHASAKSPTQCEDREELIRTDVLGLPGPGEDFTCFIPCTVIKKDDLAYVLLDNAKNPDFRGETTSAILEWPDSFEVEGSDEPTVWDEYNEARIRGLELEDEGKVAYDFYDQHKDELESGAVVGWEGRRKKNDHSALQSLMNLYYSMGKAAFFSEYQNSPLEENSSIYDISPELVSSRLNGFKRCEVPEDATMLVAMADINFIGLNVTVIAFKNDLTGWIVDHFKYPEGRRVLVKKNTPETEVAKAIANAVLDVDALLDEKPYSQAGERMMIDRKLFDANWQTEHVMAAIKSLRKARTVMGDRGTAAKQYYVPKGDRLIGKAHHKCHIEKGPKGRQIRHDADFWRMVAQKAFLLRPGVPGSLSLWGNDPERHKDYANQICAEKLIQFVPGYPSDFYNWHKFGGRPNDQLDSTVGCYPAAVSLGASLTGVEIKRKKRAKLQSQSKKPSRAIRTKYR